MAEERGWIELIIEVPEGVTPTEDDVKRALQDASQNPDFIKKVADCAAVSQTKSATAKIVVEGLKRP
jgi:hypothetical protein